MMSLLLTLFHFAPLFATMDILRYVELAGTIKQGFGLPVQPKLVVVPKAENIIRMQPKVTSTVVVSWRRSASPRPNSPTSKQRK